MYFTLKWTIFLNLIKIIVASEIEREFDFIVIGGGCAGCVVAARISEISNFTLLLLEAGDEPPFVSKIPVLASLMFNTKYDWNYTSSPQKYSANKIINLTRGKMLGGTASLNTLNWFRGNKYDYNSWKNEFNDGGGWRWESLLKYFKKSETDMETDVEEQFHGKKGPIIITNPGKRDPFVVSFLNEIKKMGYKYKDPNTGTQIGYSYTPLNMFNNVRQSTYTNYLKPVMNRSNLFVEKDAFVEKILFKNKRAFGVQYLQKGKRFIVKAKKEIILSAGAINSPQLLMLSGIGPKDHLQSLNIPVIADLPVGNNFQDHVYVPFIFTKPYKDIYTNETLEQYYDGKGPLTKFSMGNAFIRTHTRKCTPDIPDAQLSMSGFAYPAEQGKDLEYEFVPYILHPKSKGYIRLRSNNALDYPLIDPRYLSEESDLKVVTKIAKISHRICESMNVSSQGYKLQDTDIAQCNSTKRFSNDYWHCIAKNKLRTVFHFCCTCSMGNIASKSAVVDSKLRVLRIKGLRVVDASVIPNVPSSNPQAVVVMIAEKASEIIKTKYSKLFN